MKERYANQDKGVLNAAPDGGKRLVSPRRTTSTTSLIAVGGAAFVSCQHQNSNSSSSSPINLNEQSISI